MTSPPTVVSIEDPFDQDDWPAWSQFTASVGIQVNHATTVSSYPCLQNN